MKKIAAVTLVLITAVTAAVILTRNKKPDFEGITLVVASTQDISAGSYYEGAQIFAEKYGCKVEFTDNFDNADLIYSSGEDFSACMPITKYVKKRNKLYTKQIIDAACMQDGEIYGITNVLLGRLNYCEYYPDQFGDTPLPHDYFKKGNWTWDGFIEMADGIDENISVNWTDSYINMSRALYRGADGKTVFDYGTQEQVEWLNFVRTLIYDDGIVDNTEGAYKVGFLPELVLNSVAEGMPARYIPWPTKNGKLSAMFVDEYHFSVPKTAKNPKASVMLADAMIKSCVDTRMNLYESNMTAEDFAIFKKQLKKIYVYPEHTDYVPAKNMVEDFVHGKTVTEHIFNVKSGAEHIK